MTRQRGLVERKRLAADSFVIRASALFRHSSFVIRHFSDAPLRLSLRTLPVIRTNVLLPGSRGTCAAGRRSADLFHQESERRTAAGLGRAHRQTRALSARGKGVAG